MTADELIAQLEAAPEGSIDLDFQIGKWIGKIPAEWLDEFKPAGIDQYTRSLDAAMTLVLPDMFWMIGAGRLRPSEPLYASIIIRPNPDGVEGEEIGKGEHAFSPAIALCIAALNARQAA